MNRVALQRENFALIARDGLGLVISAQAVDGRGEVWTQGENALDQVVIALSLDLDCRVRGHTRQHCQLGVGELPQLQGRINQLGFSDGDPIICRGWPPGTAEPGHADDRRCAWCVDERHVALLQLQLADFGDQEAQPPPTVGSHQLLGNGDREFFAVTKSVAEP